MESEDRIDITGNRDVGDGRHTVGVGSGNECPLTMRPCAISTTRMSPGPPFRL
jgi:hypothetical protein